MITDVQIANMALALVKEQSITKLISTGAAATAVGVAYEVVLRETLEDKASWEFLRFRAQLSRLADSDGYIAPTSGGWLYQYKLPANCLRLLETIDENGDKINYPSSREVYVNGAITTDVLLSNQEFCFVRFLVNRTNPNDWPAWFTKLFYHRLAMVISGPLTKDDQRYNQLAVWTMRAYNEALAANSMESTEVNDHYTDVDNGSDLININRGYSGIS